MSTLLGKEERFVVEACADPQQSRLPDRSDSAEQDIDLGHRPRTRPGDLRVLGLWRRVEERCNL
jgi:hypothetical protein